MKRLIWILASAIGLATPAFAYATDAYVTANVDLYAGPDQGYPQIDQIEEGSQVSIQGCTSGWEWCDVIAYGERGWMPGAYLEAEYQNQWVLVPDYAPRFGVPIVVFSISNYWDAYYRYRPFYAQRWTWYRNPLPYRHWPRPVDLPPPHGFAGPPVHHRPMPMPYPSPRPGPHPMPLPYPIHPGERPNPMPNPPPRVMPTPHPVPAASSHRDDEPQSGARDRDPAEQGQHR